MRKIPNFLPGERYVVEFKDADCNGCIMATVKQDSHGHLYLPKIGYVTGGIPPYGTIFDEVGYILSIQKIEES